MWRLRIQREVLSALCSECVHIFLFSFAHSHTASPKLSAFFSTERLWILYGPTSLRRISVSVSRFPYAFVARTQRRERAFSEKPASVRQIRPERCARARSLAAIQSLCSVLIEFSRARRLARVFRRKQVRSSTTGHLPLSWLTNLRAHDHGKKTGFARARVRACKQAFVLACQRRRPGIRPKTRSL